MHAVKRDHVECTGHLIQSGASVNIRSNTGSTALVYAAQYGRRDCLEKLLQAGADVNIFYSSNWTALLAAVAARKCECVDLLLKAGADVNVKTSKANTVLYLAARSNCMRCVNLILSSGASINVLNVSGENALACYCRARTAIKQTNIIQLLCVAGEKTDRVKDSDIPRHLLLSEEKFHLKNILQGGNQKTSDRSQSSCALIRSDH